MSTLVHEDIYVYVDPIEENSITKTGSSIKFVNDSTNKVSDLGVFDITITSGSFSNLTITTPLGTLNTGIPFALNDHIVLDFRELHFTKNGTLIFLEDAIELGNNDISDIDLSFVGTGSATVKYSHTKVIPSNVDLYFCESLDYGEAISRLSKVNIKNETKVLKGEKKDYSFGINGLWNDGELNKFSPEFNLRLVDEEGKKIDILSGCRIDSSNKSSSSGGGDFSYSLSGIFKKIF
jgi:hypothetical protein